MDGIAAALADPDPMAMLGYACGIAAALDPQIPTGEKALPGLPPPAEFIGMVVEGGTREADALAWVLAHLTLDDLQRTRVLRPVNRSRLPSWMAQLANTEVYAAWQTIDVLRDSSNICFGVRVGEFDQTVVILLDYNNAGAVKDGFMVPLSLTAFQETWATLAPPEGMEFQDLELADARAQVQEGLVAGRRFSPPFTSDSWPQLQPWLEFLLRRCPTGGKVMTRPTWNDQMSDEVIEAFLRTDAGRSLPGDYETEMPLRLWLDFATHHGFGDPLLISGSKVEIFLLDSMLTSMPVNGFVLAGVPALLEAFVPFAHARRGIPESLTNEALETLRRVEPKYLANLDLSGAPIPRVPLTSDGQIDFERIVIDSLADQVGGLEQLDRLDDRPLPAEELVLDDVPDDLHQRLQVFDAIAADKYPALHDPEALTAVRRLAHDVAVADPEVFRRRAKDANTAAALCYLVARANNLIGPFASVQSKDFMAQFGVKNVSTRADSIRKVALGGSYLDSLTSLGSPRYLTSSYRRQLLGARIDGVEQARLMAAAAGFDSAP